MAAACATAAVLLLFCAHRGFPGEGWCPLQEHILRVDAEIARLRLTDGSADRLFQELGDWSIDSLSEGPATARVQARPHVWDALLGPSFSVGVATSGR